MGANKIIGIAGEATETGDPLELDAALALPEVSDVSGISLGSELNDAVTEDRADIGHDDWQQWDAPAERSSLLSYWPQMLTGTALLGWSALWAWPHWPEISALAVTPAMAADWVQQWAGPAMLILIVYLIAMRMSKREAGRFADAAQSLRAESLALETRLQIINRELTIAREFLANETRELDSLGRQAADSLTNKAKSLQGALTDGLEKMERLDAVGSTASRNLEQLREHLPVVINTAKDVTNQIGNIGRTAQADVALLVEALKRLGDTGRLSREGMEQLQSAAEATLGDVTARYTALEDQLRGLFAQSEERSSQLAESLSAMASRLASDIGDSAQALDQQGQRTAALLGTEAEKLRGEIGAINMLGEQASDALAARLAALRDQLTGFEEELVQAGSAGEQIAEQLAAHIARVDGDNSGLAERLTATMAQAKAWTQQVEALLLAGQIASAEFSESLPAALMKITTQSGESQSHFERMAALATELADTVAAVEVRLQHSAVTGASSLSAYRELLNETVQLEADSASSLNGFGEQLARLRSENEALIQSAGGELIATLLRVRDTAQQAAKAGKETLQSGLNDTLGQMEADVAARLERLIETRLAHIAPQIETQMQAIMALAQQNGAQLEAQLAALTDKTALLEQRLTDARSRAEEAGEDNFTRRVALLTEALNSTAIDVTKLLSNDVTDTEWAAYLRGDRGIFARRAVRLLDTSEARNVLGEYESNAEFREHVNRYIHDFEAMLRFVLSTREGNTVGVTLLSSDIGKLYVALAQAIDRLRG